MNLETLGDGQDGWDGRDGGREHQILAASPEFWGFV